MEKFNSLFELFGAFNFAYVLSSELTLNLQKKLEGTFESINTEIQKIDQILQQNQNYLKEILSDLPPIADHIKDCASKNSEKITTFETKKEEIDNEFKAQGLTDLFNYYSLFAGLYCLILLFFSGLGKLDLNSDIDMRIFLLFNVLSCINAILLWIFHSRFSHVITIGIFILILFITMIFCFNSDSIGKWQCFPPNLYVFNLFIAVLLPTFHFIINFTKIYKYLIFKGTNRNREILKFKRECEDLTVEIATVVKIVEKGKIELREDKN